MKEKTIAIALNAENFNHHVFENLLPVLVVFYADWSGSSDIMAPIIEELAREFSGDVVFGKIDVDEYDQIATKFGIESIPSILFFKNGRIVGRVTGIISKIELVKVLEELLS